MVTYGSIPQTEGEHGSSTPASSNKKKGTIALLSAALLGGIGAAARTKSQTVEATEAWPLELFGAGSSNGVYGGTGALDSGTDGAAGRPTTTKEATDEGWKKISDSECDTNLGNPWAFNGEITEAAPVILYFSKETDGFDGVLTGIGVNYFNGAAPTKMIEDFTFSKGEDYDTIKVAFRNEDTDVCGEGPLPSNKPLLDVVLAEGKGRKPVPVTEADAKTNGTWKAGSCIDGMGIHWEHDIVGGSTFTFEAENFYPVVPMYDDKDGSLNGVFFQAPQKMQIWDVAACGFPNLNCDSLTNMWDPIPGVPAAGSSGFAMASNFCGDYPGFTGTENGSFETMHFFFKKIAVCEHGQGACPADSPRVMI